MEYNPIVIHLECKSILECFDPTFGESTHELGTLQRVRNGAIHLENLSLASLFISSCSRSNAHWFLRMG